MSKPRVLVARRVTQAVAERARREFDAALAEQDLDAEAAVRAAAAHRAEGLVIGPKIRLDAARVAALSDHVRIVATTSVGFDHVDAGAARARGLVVTNTPDVLTDCTADLAFMLSFAHAAAPPSTSGSCARAGGWASFCRTCWG